MAAAAAAAVEAAAAGQSVLVARRDFVGSIPSCWQPCAAAAVERTPRRRRRRRPPGGDDGSDAFPPRPRTVSLVGRPVIRQRRLVVFSRAIHYLPNNGVLFSFLFFSFPSSSSIIITIIIQITGGGRPYGFRGESSTRVLVNPETTAFFSVFVFFFFSQRSVIGSRTRATDADYSTPLGTPDAATLDASEFSFLKTITSLLSSRVGRRLYDGENSLYVYSPV